MDARIEEILAPLRPGIEADGGEVEQLSPAGDGSVRICLTEKCRVCHATLWTHRLRIERAIAKAFPGTKVLFVKERDRVPE